jgi:hypothetical protein
MRFFEFLSEATLSPKELFKYRGNPRRDRIPLFLQKLQDESPFMVNTKNGVEEIILDPNEIERMRNWVENPTNSFRLKARDDDRMIPLTAIRKTKEFGGENAGQRERVEQGQIEGISADLEEAKAGKPFVKLLVGDKVVNAAAVEKERGTVNGRAPKSDMTVLDQNGDAVAWVSLKDKTFRWGGWQHLHKVPEIADWLNRIAAVTGKVFENGQAYGLHISDELKQQIIYGKNFGGERGFSNVDAVLIGWTNIKKQGKQFVLTSDTVYKNGDIPSGPHTPYLVMRFMNGRNDLGFKNVRAETNTVSEGRKVRWLDSDQDVKANVVQQKQTPAPINRPDNNKVDKVNIKANPEISKNTSELDKEQL